MREYDEFKMKCLDGRGGDLNIGQMVGGMMRIPILHWASLCNDFEFVAWLLLHRGVDPNCLNPDGTSALFFTDDLMIGKFLLWKGCDLFRKDKYGGNMFDLWYDIDLIEYGENEYMRKIILMMIFSQDSTLHKDLWREVAEWL